MTHLEKVLHTLKRTRH